MTLRCRARPTGIWCAIPGLYEAGRWPDGLGLGCWNLDGVDHGDRIGEWVRVVSLAWTGGMWVGFGHGTFLDRWDRVGVWVK